MPVTLPPRKQFKSSAKHNPAASGIGRLTRWYLTGLGLLAVVSVTGQAAVQYTLHQRLGDARVLSQVGRQPALSQKLALEAVAVQSAPTPSLRAVRAEELRLTAEEWNRSQENLAQGQSARWAEALPLQKAMQKSANDLLAALPADSSRQTPNLSPEIEALLQNEKSYLQAMEGVTAAYEAETKTNIQSLQHLEGGLLAVTLLALLAQGALLFQPGRIRQTIQAQKEMEARLNDQDSALTEADKQVADMQNTLANLSSIDALTGLKNHRGVP